MTLYQPPIWDKEPIFKQAENFSRRLPIKTGDIGERIYWECGDKELRKKFRIGKNLMIDLFR